MVERLGPDGPDAGEDHAQGAGVTAVVLLLSSLTVMANATIAPALPGLAAAFEGTPRIDALAGLALSLPSLSIVLTAGLFGLAADRLDRRALLAALCILYGAAGASGAVAPGLWSLLGGRVLLGVAVAGVMTLVTQMAGELWRGPARERFLGLQAAATSAGGIAFLLAGGFLAEASWRGPFLVYLVAVPLAPIAYLALRRPLADRDRAPSRAHAAVPWRAVLEVGSLAFLAMVAFYLIPTRLPFRMAALGDASPTLSGAAIACVTLASVPASLTFPRIRTRFLPKTIFGGALGAMAGGLALIGVADGPAAIFAGCLLVGAGLGFVVPNQVSWLMARVGDDARGRAAGLLTMAIFAGQFAAPLFAAALEPLVGLGATFRIAGIGVLTMASVCVLTRGSIPMPRNHVREGGGA